MFCNSIKIEGELNWKQFFFLVDNEINVKSSWNDLFLVLIEESEILQYDLFKMENVSVDKWINIIK